MKTAKTFRLSKEAVSVLEEQDNATQFLEKLILQKKTISEGEALILDKLDGLSSNGRTEAFGASNLGSNPNEPAIPPTQEEEKDTYAGLMQVCCLGTTPCKHWIFDSIDGIWVNLLSGDKREG